MPAIIRKYLNQNTAVMNFIDNFSPRYYSLQIICVNAFRVSIKKTLFPSALFHKPLIVCSILFFYLTQQFQGSNNKVPFTKYVR